MYSENHLEAESQVLGLGPGFPFGNFYIWELVKQKKLTTILARTFLLRSPLCANRSPVILVIWFALPVSEWCLHYSRHHVLGVVKWSDFTPRAKKLYVKTGVLMWVKRKSGN